MGMRKPGVLCRKGEQHQRIPDEIADLGEPYVQRRGAVEGSPHALPERAARDGRVVNAEREMGPVVQRLHGAADLESPRLPP
jgi:hypothetical protein